MINISYKELLHPRIQQVLGKVANTQMDPTQSYEVNKLLAAIRKTIESTRAESTEILKNFVKFENGKPKFKDAEEGAQPQVEFIDPFNPEHPDYLAAFEAFEKKESQIYARLNEVKDELKDGHLKLEGKIDGLVIMQQTMNTNLAELTGFLKATKPNKS